MAPHPKRSKAETAFVQLLLDALQIINDAISTATGPVSWSLADRGTGSRLLDAWPNMIPASLRPPRLMLPSGSERLLELQGIWGSNQRAADRLFRTIRLGMRFNVYDGVLGWPHLTWLLEAHLVVTNPLTRAVVVLEVVVMVVVVLEEEQAVR